MRASFIWTRGEPGSREQRKQGTERSKQSMQGLLQGHCQSTEKVSLCPRDIAFLEVTSFSEGGWLCQAHTREKAHEGQESDVLKVTQHKQGPPPFHTTLQCECRTPPLQHINKCLGLGDFWAGVVLPAYSLGHHSTAHDKFLMNRFIYKIADLALRALQPLRNSHNY